MTNLVGLVRWLKEDFYLELTTWERQFIDEMEDGLEGLPFDLPDDEAREYITPSQERKIREIAENVGIK